jgi:hypothetical protein
MKMTEFGAGGFDPAPFEALKRVFKFDALAEITGKA